MADENNFAKRLDMVERDLRDHAKTFTALTEQMNVWQARIGAVENVIRKMEIAEARAEERELRLNERLKNIDLDLEAIRGVGTKLLWIVAGGVITAFLAFLLKGGLIT